MMRSLFSGVAGLKSHQTRMDTVGNNIANVNTVGFKSSRTTFADTLYQTLSGASGPTTTQGGTNPKQIGLGTGVASIDTIFTDGSVQSTGKNTDLCLSGSGLFVVKNGNGTYYTRDGAFEFDSSGNYVLPGNGMYVQGWTASGTGSDRTIDTTGEVGNIQIKAGSTMAATATTKATYSNNLQSAIPTISSMTLNLADGTTTTINSGTTPYYVGETSGSTTISSISLTLSDGTTQTITSGSASYTYGHSEPISTTLTVYDSEGNSHTVPVLFEKTASNTWQLGLASTSTGTVSSGGTVTLSDGTTVALTATDLAFTSSGAYASGSASLATTYATGAAAGSVTLDLSGLTQYSSSSTIAGSANGNADGTLKSVSVDSTGTITGTYTNGITQKEAQVAIAQFNNPAGLTKSGSNLYTKSNNSGEPNVKSASALGVTITPSSLEMSNVDLANEFSDMIITQRGFQSNSKIITVSDEMLETLVNMKR